MEIIIVLLLTVLNGIFAMAEIAVISARKHKLQKRAQEGSKRAKAALELARKPNRFLSTSQVGITLVGVFAGAFGGATIAKQVSAYLHHVPVISPYSDALGIVLVVLGITYLSIVIGELVPKRIALSYPEAIASLLARPMNLLSLITAPIVGLLTFSTDSVLNMLGIKQRDSSGVSEEEIRMMIKEGTKLGVFETAEKDIVERTFNLGDRRVNSLMTSAKEIVWLDMDNTIKTIRNKIVKNPHPNYPVYRRSVNKILGIVRTEDLLTNFLSEGKIELLKSLHKPLFIPTSMAVLNVLEVFKKSGIHIALVVDEYGNVQGLLSLTDILEAIVGDIPTVNEVDEKEIIKRDKNSWLIDGVVTLEKFKEHFHVKKLSGEKTGAFHTIGGFVTHKLGRIPGAGDKFEWDYFVFQVVDMDGNRVDKVLLTKQNKKARN